MPILVIIKDFQVTFSA